MTAGGVDDLPDSRSTLWSTLGNASSTIHSSVQAFRKVDFE
jgi:hypothetical protein